MLGIGEKLRKLTVTVEQLLNRNAKHVREWNQVLHKGLGIHITTEVTLFPRDGGVESPCPSILVTVERGKRHLGPRCVSTQLVPPRSISLSP